MSRTDQVHDGRAPAAGDAGAPDDAAVEAMLARTLAYARRRDYTGWDYGDGMSSRLRRALPVDSKWVNVAFQEAVKRAPVNVRPLLLVERRRSYQGAALFAMANLAAGGALPAGAGAGAGTEVDYRAEARSLADWLVENSTEGYGGFCAGFAHPIQHLDGRGEAREPDVISTSFGVEALLRAGALDERYPAAVESAADFVVEDLDYRPAESGPGAVIDYHTKHPQDYFTVNAGAVCARMLVGLYDRFGDPELLERARGILDHVAALQTDRGGWYYREPRSASHLSMDTHHNGFVVESFQRYDAVVGDGRYDDTREAALRFLRRELFEDSGAPNFDEESAYPRNVNAAAQGVLAFTYAGDRPFARRILGWTFEHLHAGDGRFYTERTRWYTQRVTLMRWCQAWMAFAMAEFLDARASG